MKNKLSLESTRYCLLSPGYLQTYLDSFTKELSNKGYTNLTLQGYYGSIAHFGTWLQKRKIALEEINDCAVIKFAKHACHCYTNRRHRKISRKYIARIQRFVEYLRQKKIILPKINIPKVECSSYLQQFKESLHIRGLAPNTIAYYGYSISKLLLLLGDNPKKYNANQIRKVICNLAKQKSRCEIKKTNDSTKSIFTIFNNGKCLLS